MMGPAGACAALAIALTAVSHYADAAADSSTADEILIHAGRLLAQPRVGTVRSKQTVVVQAGRITRIVDGYLESPGVTVVDLADSFVLPGLIDCHVHLLSDANMQAITRGWRTSAQMAFHGVGNADATLKAGFTTVADLGGENEAIFALRDAIAAGLVDGPRILASGTLLTPHGGDSDIHDASDDYAELFRAPTVCSGVEGCRKAVRQQVNRGADLIKLTATGGVLAQTATGLGQQFLDDELQAVVEAAHSFGRRVAAHAHGVAGINAALKAGVDSIEHGTFLDLESTRLFRRNGAYLVPTLLAGETIMQGARDPNWRTASVRAKALEVGPRMIDATRRAHAHGVKIAFGTDSGVSPHGENAREFSLLVEAGLTPLEAIIAATTAAADHLGIVAEAGSLEPGKGADLVAVRGDPLTDVSELERIRFVMRDGKIIVKPAD